MFSFDGKFKKRPVVSLRGSTTNNDAHQLLMHNKDERNQRDFLRKQECAALLIQSVMKGYTTKFKFKQRCRTVFDHLMREIPEDVNLWLRICFRNLNMFFSPIQDRDRVMTFCRRLITNNDVRTCLIEMITGQSCELSDAVTQGRFLCNLIIFLDSLPTSAESQEFSHILRVVEICLLPQSPNGSSMVCSDYLIAYLVRHDYVSPLTRFTSRHLPRDAAADRLLHNLALPSALFRLILTPVERVLQIQQKHDSNRNNELLSFLFERLFDTLQSLSSTLHEAVTLGLVGRIPLPKLLQALLTSDVSALRVAPSLPLLRCLTLALEQQAPATTEDAGRYLLVLQHLLGQLPTCSPPRLCSAVSPSSVEDDDNDDGHFNDEDDDNISEGWTSSTRQSLRVLCSPMFAELVREALSGDLRQTSAAVLKALCRLLYSLLVNQALSPSRLLPLLTTCGHTPGLLPRIWILVTQETGRTGSQLLLALAQAIDLTPDELNRVVPLLYAWATLMRSCLLSLHDRDFFSGAAGPLSDLTTISASLRDAMLGLIELAHPNTRPNVGEDYRRALASLGPFRYDWSGVGQGADQLRNQLATWSALFSALQACVSQLYARHRRRAFCSDNHWLAASWVDSLALQQSSLRSRHSHGFSQAHSALPTERTWMTRGVALRRVPFGYYSALNPDREQDADSPQLLSTTEARQLTVLTEMPFVMNFRRRVDLFYSLVNADRINMQHARDRDQGGGVHPFDSIRLKIRRTHLYEDAFDKLSLSNEPDLRPRWRVDFLNQLGLHEAGVDGGGLAREFLAQLLHTGFDPNRGFFVYTCAEAQRTLYPNPGVEALGIARPLDHLFFLGRILAKALYEGQLVELPLAAFFLAKVLSRGSGDVDIDYLQYLDPQLYVNLLSLKDYAAQQVADLDLDFTTVTSSGFDEATQLVELKAGGRNETVTAANRVEYIHLMANFRLNFQLRRQCRAFVAGLNQVFPIDWLRLFDPQELHVLISGADVPIDLDDLREHTHYYGECTVNDTTVEQFWAVMEHLVESDKRALLKFVTSCSRPPLFGFRELHPPFSIQLVPETERLPTASTCMNLLKLPNVRDPNILREKLLYVIHAGAGFELT